MTTTIETHGWPIEDVTTLRSALERDGAVIIKGLVPSETIGELARVVRSRLQQSGSRFALGRTEPGASTLVPTVASLVTSEPVAHLMSEVFADEGAMYTGHCDIHMNMVSGWHKDSGETVRGGYFRGDYFNDPSCRVYKLAVYLQDTQGGAGLGIRPGSHQSSGLNGGRDPVDLETDVGDAVLFDVRLSHIGNPPDPIERLLQLVSNLLKRGDRNTQDDVLTSHLAATYRKMIRRDDRLSIFFTYGAANQFTEHFATANVARQAAQSKQASDEELVARVIKTLASYGIRPSEALAVVSGGHEAPGPQAGSV